MLHAFASTICETAVFHTFARSNDTYAGRLTFVQKLACQKNPQLTRRSQEQWGAGEKPYKPCEPDTSPLDPTLW